MIGELSSYQILMGVLAGGSPLCLCGLGEARILARAEFCDGCAQRGFREEFPIDRTIRATRHVSGHSSETTRERESCSCSRELELQQLSGR